MVSASIYVAPSSGILIQCGIQQRRSRRSDVVHRTGAILVPPDNVALGDIWSRVANI